MLLQARGRVFFPKVRDGLHECAGREKTTGVLAVALAEMREREGGGRCTKKSSSSGRAAGASARRQREHAASEDDSSGAS